MLKWFYDSLETLEQVEFAKKKDYRNLWTGVVIAIVVFWAFFIGVDTLWSGLYNGYHNIMKNAWFDTANQQLLVPNDDAWLLDWVDELLLDDELTIDGGIDLSESEPLVDAEDNTLEDANDSDFEDDNTEDLE